MPEAGNTVSFEYIKSGLFRVVHADGAIGALTPAGNLHMAFYSERPAMPNLSVHTRFEDNTIGEPISQEKFSKASYIREIDVDVVLDSTAVASLIEFLQARLKEMSAPDPEDDATDKASVRRART